MVLAIDDVVTREQFEQEMQADQERQERLDAKTGWHVP